MKENKRTRYTVKENTCLKKRINWNTKKYHNKFSELLVFFI